MKKIFILGTIVVLFLVFVVSVSANLVINGVVVGDNGIWTEIVGNATFDGGVNITGYYYGNGSKLTGVSGCTDAEAVATVEANAYGCVLVHHDSTAVPVLFVATSDSGKI